MLLTLGCLGFLRSQGFQHAQQGELRGAWGSWEPVPAPEQCGGPRAFHSCNQMPPTHHPPPLMLGLSRLASGLCKVNLAIICLESHPKPPVGKQLEGVRNSGSPHLEASLWSWQGVAMTSSDFLTLSLLLTCSPHCMSSDDAGSPPKSTGVGEAPKLSPNLTEPQLPRL